VPPVLSQFKRVTQTLSSLFEVFCFCFSTLGPVLLRAVVCVRWSPYVPFFFTQSYTTWPRPSNGLQKGNLIGKDPVTAFWKDCWGTNIFEVAHESLGKFYSVHLELGDILQELRSSVLVLVFFFLFFFVFFFSRLQVGFPFVYFSHSSLMLHGTGSCCAFPPSLR